MRLIVYMNSCSDYMVTRNSVLEFSLFLQQLKLNRKSLKKIHSVRRNLFTLILFAFAWYEYALVGFIQFDKTITVQSFLFVEVPHE